MLCNWQSIALSYLKLCFSSQKTLLSLSRSFDCEDRSGSYSKRVERFSWWWLYFKLFNINHLFRHSPVNSDVFSIDEIIVFLAEKQTHAQSVISVAAAGNICAIKCFSGTANAAAAAVDAMTVSYTHLQKCRSEYDRQGCKQGECLRTRRWLLRT